MHGAEGLVALRQAQAIGLEALELGEAKVGDSHAAFAVDQDVLGLDVPVDDAEAVGCLQGFAHLWDELQYLLGGKAAFRHELAEARAFDVLEN